jgi:hypothetical protein
VGRPAPPAGLTRAACRTRGGCETLGS